MKRALFFFFTALGFFVLLSVIILPEYRIRTLILLAVYLVVYYFVFKMLVLEHVRSLSELFFRKRTMAVISSLIVFILCAALGIAISESRVLKKARYQAASNDLASISGEQKDYLKEHVADVFDVVYIRPTQGQDNTALFNSIMQEISLYAKGVRYLVLHPVAQADRYSQIRKDLPSLVHGEVAVIGAERSVVVDKVSGYDIINGLYRARSGLNSVCVIQGHGEASVDDFSEEGAGIVAQMLRDRGISLVRADLEYLSSCPAALILEPKKDLSANEIKALDSYNGGLVMVGGFKLPSVKRFLGSRGLSVALEPVSSISQGALRDYFGGLVVDMFYQHPATSYVKSPAVVSSAYEIICPNCTALASASSKNVMVVKDNLSFFSGSSLYSNFFMRFKGNSQLLFGVLNNACCGSGPVAPPDSNGLDSPKLFAISPRYLNIIFAVSVILLPLLFLALGIYCFRSNRG